MNPSERVVLFKVEGFVFFPCPVVGFNEALFQCSDGRRGLVGPLFGCGCGCVKWDWA